MHEAYKVLFVSACESARALMAAALLKQADSERFTAWCANGTGQVHPLTLEFLRSHRLWNHQQSASVEQFAGNSAPVMDFVINLGEKLPEGLWKSFPGNPVKAQWRITDPLAFKADPKQRNLLFRRSLTELDNRVKLFALVWGRSFGQRILAA